MQKSVTELNAGLNRVIGLSRLKINWIIKFNYSLSDIKLYNDNNVILFLGKIYGQP